MISVVVYGRNDSHGYNLPKRAAISLNCIAEILTDPHDEILFVDCNTPDDMPTFPEAIADTLTRKAKELIRVFRIRPALFDKYKKGSPLKVLEPLSRNVAMRRSNPLNRWILSTNPDMVFVMRQHGKSLSDTVETLPDGFYGLPRFELPVTIWEGLDRLRPGDTMGKLSKWSRNLHLNEVVCISRVVIFEAPGDFQLMLRDQISQLMALMKTW